MVPMERYTELSQLPSFTTAAHVGEIGLDALLRRDCCHHEDLMDILPVEIHVDMVKTNSTPVVHTKIAGIYGCSSPYKWYFHRHL
jgi:hypothetical protein